MDINGHVSRTVAAVLVYLLTVNPLLAAGLQVDGSQGGNTTVGQAGNGVPLVNIATPNGSGISHNRFTDYNVDQKGLILNNSTGRFERSQLGGLLQNNPNLNSGAARLILNEVTGTRPSLLQGYTEVFGQKAAVVVANPYGISCNGCGFINTPRATLTTGAPQVVDGALQGFDVNNGSVVIEGLGLNATNVDQFDIISRAITLNAEINARNLNMIVGRNNVSYPTLDAQAKTDAAPDSIDFALDASVLGAMYANSIYLVGTESGVGVRALADMAVSASDLVLDVNGNLSLSKASAANDLRVASNGDISVSGDLYAGNRLQATADNVITLDGKTSASNAVTIDAAVIQQNGILAAGVNPDGILNNRGDINITADQLINKDTVRASRSLQIDVNQLTNSDAQLLSDQALALRAQNLDNRKGVINAATSSQLSVVNTTDNAEGLIQAGTLSISGAAINNAKGEILTTAGALELETADALDNTDGVVASASSLAIHAGDDVDNSGGSLIALGEGDLATELVVAGNLVNTAGRIESNNNRLIIDADGQIQNQNGEVVHTGSGVVLVDAARVENSSGAIKSNGVVSLTATELANQQGTISAARLQAQVADRINNTQGLIEADSLSIATATLNNSGGRLVHYGSDDQQITASAELLNTESAGIQGSIESKANRFNLSSARLVNSGEIIHDGNDALALVTGQLENNGLINGEHTLAVDAETVVNDQGTLGANDITITTRSALDNNNGRIVADNDLAITSEGMANQGGVIAGENVDLDAGSFALLNASGTIEAGSELSISAQAIDNRSGNIRSLADVGNTQIQAVDLILNDSGSIAANTETLALVAGTVQNRGGSIVHAGTGDLQIQAAYLDNGLGGSIQSNGALRAQDIQVSNVLGALTADRIQLSGNSALDNIGGVVEANQLDLSLQGDLTNEAGRISQLGDSDQTLAAGSINNGNGRIETNATHLNLVADQVNGAGGILHYGLGRFILDATGTATNQGDWFSNGDIRINADQFNNLGGRLFANNVAVNSNGLINLQGQLNAVAGSLVLDINGDINNTLGRLWGSQNLTINSGELSNVGGIVEAQEILDLQIAGYVHGADSVLDAGTRVTQVNTGNLVNEAGGQLLTDSHWDMAIGGSLINRGEISALGDVILNADTLVNEAGAVFTSGENAQLSLVDAVINGGKISANHSLQLTAKRLFNTGTLAAGEGMTLNLSENSNNSGLIFAGEDLNYYSVGQLTNQWGDIFALGNVLIARDQSLARAGALENRSGTIEAFGGTLSIYTESLLNTKDLFAFETRTSTDRVKQWCTDCSGDHYTGYATITRYTTDVVTEDSPAANLLSATGMRIDAGTLNNAYSNMQSGGDMQLTGTSLVNSGFAGGERIVTETRNGRMTDGTYERTADEVNQYNQGRRLCTWCLGGDVYRVLSGNLWRLNSSPWAQQKRTESYVAQIEHQGLIKAGGSLTGSFTGQIDNVNITQNTGQLGLTAKSVNTDANGRTLQGVSANPFSGSLDDSKTIHDQAVAQVVANTQTDVSGGLVDVTLGGEVANAYNPLALPGFLLPDGSYGAFSLNTDPTHPYLIESNPVFSDFGYLVNSDYLLNALGYSEQDYMRRLGDGFYETRLVRDMVREATGNRFLYSDITSDSEQYQQLMVNAEASQRDLNLSLGVALSAEQAARLTRDIVWLVEQEVAGQKVLVPVLYLAGTDKRLTADGALIAGENVQLESGGHLVNSGGIRATDSLLLNAEGSLLNSGTLQGVERLQATAGGSLINRSGHIDGGRVTLEAISGDVINSTEIEQQRSGEQFRGDSAKITTLMGDRATITARELEITAGRDVQVVAGKIAVADNLNVQAGGDIAIASGELRSRTGSEGRKGHYLDDNVWHEASEISAGDNATFNAGNDIQVLGSKISAGENLSLLAANDVEVVSVANTAEFSYKHETKGSFGRKSSHKIDASKVEQVKGHLQAGDTLKIQTGDDTTIRASRLDGEIVDLEAEGTLTLGASKNVDKFEEHKSKSSSVWQKSSGEGRTDETVVHTEIHSDELKVSAKEGIKADILQIDGKNVQQSIATLSKQPGLEWMAQLKDDPNVDWNRVQELHDQWDYESQGLTGPASAVIVIIVIIATQGAGAFLAGGGTAAAGSSLGLSAMATQAAVTSLATQATLSTINNQGNLGAVLKDLGSSQAIRSLATSVATAGMGTGFSELTAGLGEWEAVAAEIAKNAAVDQLTNGGSLGDSLQYAALNQFSQHSSDALFEGLGEYLPDASNDSAWESIGKVVGRSASDAAVDHIINSGDFGVSFQSGLVNNSLISLTGGVGELSGLQSELAGDAVADGSWQKVLAHALVGCAQGESQGGGCASGAVGAATAELVSPYLSDSGYSSATNEEIVKNLSGAVAGFSGLDMDTASSAGLHTDRYNRQMHFKEAKALEEAIANDPANEHAIKAAACALVKCSKGVSESDDNYEQLASLEAEGLKYKQYQDQLKATGAFEEYSERDSYNDFLLRHDKIVVKTGGVVKVAAGTAGAVGGAAATGASAVACPVTGGSCFLVPIAGAGTYLSATEAVDGYEILTADYQSDEGQRVLDSFAISTHPGDRDRLNEIGVDALIASGEIVLAKVGGKYVVQYGKAVNEKIGDTYDSAKNKFDELFLGGGKDVGGGGPDKNLNDNAVLNDSANPISHSGKTASDNKYFTSTKEYQAPDSGTGYKYKVYQQDIDPDLRVEVKNPVTKQTRITTNRELMQNGKAPYVVRDGKTVRVELHHSRQNAEGPLFELSSPTHNVKTGQGGEALHPYKTKRGRELNGEGSGPTKSSHPENPVDRTKFDKDREQYYKDRIEEIDGDA